MNKVSEYFIKFVSFKNNCFCVHFCCVAHRFERDYFKRNGCAKVQLLRTVKFFCERALFRAVVPNRISWAKECSFAAKFQDCQTKIIGWPNTLKGCLVRSDWVWLGWIYFLIPIGDNVSFCCSVLWKKDIYWSIKKLF